MQADIKKITRKYKQKHDGFYADDEYIEPFETEKTMCDRIIDIPIDDLEAITGIEIGDGKSYSHIIKVSPRKMSKLRLKITSMVLPKWK